MYFRLSIKREDVAGYSETVAYIEELLFNLAPFFHFDELI